METEIAIRESVVDIKKSRLRKKIIRELYDTGNCTIAHLARLVHASVPSVTALIDELIVEKWLLELGTGEAQFGRKPVLYGLNPYRHLTLVLDISTHDTQLVIFNLGNQIVAQQETGLPLEDASAYVDNLFSLIDSFLLKSKVSRSDLLGVGVSLPGLINPATGMNYTYQHLNDADHSFGERIQGHLQNPVFLINDTKATVLGEQRFGLAQGKNFVLSINIDWGVGLGILLNGEVFSGASGFAGELGHIQVRRDGAPCHCGKKGCLDTVASASALVKRVRTDLLNGQETELAQYRNELERVDVEKVIEAAKQGDTYSIDMLEDISQELGRGLAMAVQLFNPEMIIVDGVLAKAGAFITNPLEQAIRTFCLSDFNRNLTIEVSQLGGLAKLYGAQVCIVEQVLENQ
ncbi:ROK family transcriptional regulator [Tellurirhabdus rosea]|uniref:ROK family transcriptional regulator n=1 Tax=Tellurirhabdus rosea TaxID=2674997 RepID=UPI00225217DC|nr:ROK family transcriptional regulator [Tellurirhabdus rosea]